MASERRSTGRQVMEIDDAVRMRALAHPVRLAILEHLENGTTATATELATLVGLSPSATSYHLRELARGGLIREAEGRGDGRERVWQGAADGFHYDSDNVSDHERDEAHGLLGALISWQDAEAQRFYATMPTVSREWQDASAFYGARIVVTAAELRDLCARIRELIEVYSRGTRDRPADAADVSMVVRAMPRLGNAARSPDVGSSPESRNAS
ncbi:MAG TPA: winged helix-turn-helix domain-containing protein [Micromonosporaceae bacterium]|nr:winged helix-turn-helix domain-containing protein [Micromonosporaceae bacterium]